MKISLRTAVLIGCSWTMFGIVEQPVLGQRFYALLVSDQSEWAQWGEHLPNVLMDMTHMRVILENNIPARQLSIRELPFELDPGSPQAIQDQLRELRPGPHDTVMFYFTGHGQTDNRGHYLYLEEGKLYRSEITRALLARKPRLAVVITDCCNVRSDKFAYLAPNIRTEPPPKVTPLFQSLFFDSQGLVDVNACSPGESAWFFVEKDPLGLPQGSLFSRTLTRYWEDNRTRATTWDQTLSDVGYQVHKAFRRNYPTGAASTVKGRQRQRFQNVYAIDYPGMPEKQGPRTGITVRDFEGSGALIVKVQPGQPGEEVFDLATEQYVPLRGDQVIVSANGIAVTDVKEFGEIVKASPQFMRLTIQDSELGIRQYIMRLRY